MEKNILDQQTRKDYGRLLAALEKQNMHEDDAAVVAMKFMEKNYQQGASFNTENDPRSYKKVLILVGVVIVGVVTYMIIKNKKKGSKNNLIGGSKGGVEAGTTGGSTGGTTTPKQIMAMVIMLTE